MKIIITEHQFNEVVTKQKNIFGAGIFHKVYTSKSNPNIVFKVGELSTTQEAYQFFTNYPYLFPKVYGFKKLKDKKNEDDNDLYYLILEKLDTHRFVEFWKRINEITRKKYERRFQSIVVNFLEDAETWRGLLEYLDEFESDVFTDTHEFYLLLNELNEIYDFPDLHDGQFGYDKEGTLKCLDF